MIYRLILSRLHYRAEELHDYSKRLARTDLLASQRKRALEKAGESIETDDQLSQIEDVRSPPTLVSSFCLFPHPS